MHTVRIAVLALVALLLAGMGYLYVSDWASAPAFGTSAILARTAHYDVRIRRDNFGVPHILGKTDADTAFGLGFAHSEDDFATIQTLVLATRGQLAARDGQKAAPGDYLVHAFRIWETLNAHYGELPEDVRKVVEAYADGINLYAAKHPEKRDPSFAPATGKDVVAGFMYKTPFFYSLDKFLKELTKKTTKDTPDNGSNGLAVAPSRSADGATRLLINSHQPYEGPVAWYEAVVQSGEGWHMAGGLFPGSPFVLLGFNEHLGWANTVNNPDLADSYKLVINPANEHQYKLDNKWRDFEVEDVPIRVKLIGPLKWTFHRELLFSEHGPVFKTDHGVYAVRYAGIGEFRQVEQYYRLNKAASQDEWLAAMRLLALPSINYIYADEKGTIGYVYNGEFPVRSSGFDWLYSLPGTRSDLIWHAYHPFAELPQIWNPRSGFVFNSNNTPFQASGPEDNLKAANFPADMGLQTNMTNRAVRAVETYGQDTSITGDEFRAYKYDLAYSTIATVMKEIAQIEKVNPGADADLKQAQAILAAWDRRTDQHNRGAALAVLMEMRVSQTRLSAKPLGSLAALEEAIANLKKHFGRLDPEWGEVNRFVRGKINAPVDGGPDVYRAVTSELQPNGTLKAVHGDTLIMFVTWDKDGRLSADSVHQFGAATLDQNSPHYADQVPLFLAMKTKPVLFTEDQLKDHIEADYRPADR